MPRGVYTSRKLCIAKFLALVPENAHTSRCHLYSTALKKFISILIFYLNMKYSAYFTRNSLGILEVGTFLCNISCAIHLHLLACRVVWLTVETQNQSLRFCQILKKWASFFLQLINNKAKDTVFRSFFLRSKPNSGWSCISHPEHARSRTFVLLCYPHVYFFCKGQKWKWSSLWGNYASICTRIVWRSCNTFQNHTLNHLKSSCACSFSPATVNLRRLSPSVSSLKPFMWDKALISFSFGSL